MIDKLNKLIQQRDKAVEFIRLPNSENKNENLIEINRCFVEKVYILAETKKPSTHPPPIQEPRVIKEGEQPKKPTLDDIGDRIRMSKNYRIAENEGKFWIEKLVINKNFSVGGLIFDVQQEWKCVPNPLFSKSLNESKKDLEDLIEKEIIKQSNKTKYNYL
jgi:hypothetical protein